MKVESANNRTPTNNQQQQSQQLYSSRKEYFNKGKAQLQKSIDQHARNESNSILQGPNHHHLRS